MGKKYNNIPREKIANYWKANIGNNRINTTWENATNCCWACGMKMPLERAHIIPEILGGPMLASNMVLLCNHCHSQNPETVYPEFFWMWIAGRIKLQELYNRPIIAFTSHDQEYELMFDKEWIINSASIERESYRSFGYEETIKTFRFFLDLHKPKCFYRYPSSSVIIMYKFLKQMEYLLRRFYKDYQHPEVVAAFPHLKHPANIISDLSASAVNDKCYSLSKILEINREEKNTVNKVADKHYELYTLSEMIEIEREEKKNDNPKKKISVLIKL